jgi:hypothetical protein
VRFTLRRLMAAVAILALLTWGGIQGEKRRARFHDLSTLYASREASYSLFHGSVPDGDYWKRR